MQEIRSHKGIELSSVGIGTWAIGGPYWTLDEPTGWGGPLDDEDSVEGLVRAMNRGITHIDTADVYGYGKSERLVGRALSSVDVTPKIASKVGFVGTSSPNVYSPENIRFQCEQSLRNINTDTIDIYYIHHTDFGENYEFLDDAVEEFNKLKTEGKIRSIGLSGYSAEGLMRVSTKLKPDFIQSWATIEHREFIDPSKPLCQHMEANGIRFVAMMPFGQGRILGKYSSASVPTFEHGDNRIGNPEFEEESLRQFEPRLSKLRERFGETPDDLIVPALGYLLSHPIVVSVIPGFRNSSQVSGILKAAEKAFTSDDKSAIDKIFPMEAMPDHPWSE